VVSGVLDRVRWYAASSVEVLHAALSLTQLVGAQARGREIRARLLTQVTLMAEAVARAANQDHDVEALRVRADEVSRGPARA
jgi:hypothetical protein